MHAAALMKQGLGAEEACEAAIVRPVTDDAELHKAMIDILKASF
jgi:nitric oxide reductase NorQ protein